MWNRTPRWFPNLFKNGRLQKSAKIQPSQQHCERRGVTLAQSAQRVARFRLKFASPLAASRRRSMTKRKTELRLVGWVCSSSAQKEAKKAAAVLSVSFLDAPCSAPLKSWLVVARGASARLRLVGHLGWVHRHEASPVGQPRELMMHRRLMPSRALLPSTSPLT